MISPEILRRFSLFSGMNTTDFKNIAMIAEEIHLKAGDWLFYENDEANWLYLIMNGEINLRVGHAPAENTPQDIVDTLVRGDVTGWSAVVEPHIYKLNAVAHSDVNLVKIDAVSLGDLMQHNPQMGYMLMSRIAQIIGTRLMNVRIRMASLIPE